MDDAERFHPGTVEEWAAWLDAHHATSEGVWLVSWRRRSGHAPLPYEEVILEALRHGWIDGKALTLDEDRSMLWFTRRRPGSPWSAPNKRRVARLVDEGRMLPAGQAAVDLARSTGTWSLLDDAEALVEPPELTELLDARPAARAGWDALPPSVRKQALSHVALARRDDTRRRRIATVVERCERGERPV